MRKTFWIRSVAVVNLALGSMGLVTEVNTIRSFLLLMRAGKLDPNLARPFFVMSTITLLLLLGLAVASYYLIRLKPSGPLLVNIVFAAEILYLVSLIFLGNVLDHSFAGAVGIANMGLSFQRVIFYPVFGLIVLNIARSRDNLSGRVGHQRG